MGSSWLFRHLLLLRRKRSKALWLSTPPRRAARERSSR
jgi:hypothetical protein